MVSRKQYYFLRSLFFLISTLIFVDSFAQTCPEGMQHYWKFDEQSGVVFIDEKGNNAGCGTQPDVNCPVFVTAASPIQIGSSTLFFDNAASQGAEIPDDGTFDWGVSASFSIEFWMASDFNAFTDNVVIVGRDERTTEDGIGVHWWIGIEGDPFDGTTNDGTIRFQLRDNDNNPAAPYLGGKGLKINDGGWHHIAAVRDGNNNENRIYIDGIEVDKKSYTYSSGFNSASPITLGHLVSGINMDRFFYKGLIDELAVYDRVLAPSEIMNHANNRLDYCSNVFLGVNKKDISTNLKLFPNPINEDRLSFSFTNNIYENFEVSVYDMSGKILMVDAFTKHDVMIKKNIDVSMLSKGFYLLSLSSKEFTAIKKFVKE